MDLLREKLRARGAQRLACSDAPDTSGMNDAARRSADLGERAMNWYTEEYARQAPMRDRAAQRADEVSLAQLDQMRRQTALTDEYAQRRRTVFDPLEDELVNDARSFDTEAKREELAGLARADTAQAFGNARGQLRRDLGRYGANPADGKFLGMTKDLATSEALADSFGRNKARSDATTLGRAMRYDAAALGRGLASNSATAAGLSINAGNAAAANGQVPVQLAQSGASMMGQGYDRAMQGYGQAGNIYGNQANIQQRAGDNSALWGTVGQVAGMFLSDEKAKKDVKPVKGEVALSAARKMPVKKWQYKKGHGDGGKHVGPMAQDAQAAMGDKAAPGGKQIDPISLAGVTLAAVQELDKKVTALSNAKRRR